MSSQSAIQGEPEDQHLEDQEGRSWKDLLFWNDMPSWLVSFLVHTLLIIILALAAWTIPGKEIVGLVAGEEAPQLDDSLVVDSSEDSSEENSETTNEAVENSQQEQLEDVVQEFEVDSESIVDSPLFSEMSEAVGEQVDVAGPGPAQGQVSGRSGDSRMGLVRKNGGNQPSEDAVKAAMDWIAKHQLADGSWSFDHRVGPNASERASPNPGDFLQSPNAATALALLVFLGAGQTHIEGDYKETVERGLAFLIKNGNQTPRGMSFYERQGGLYNHGLVAIALCEAYAMTDDVRFANTVRETIKFVETSQDKVGGGWRYEIGQAGDTSAVGWQVMALKSAYMCGIDVNKVTIRKARRFLNFVSSESGSFYGYAKPSTGRYKELTSVGLLCQMYLGWTKENPALQRGVEWLGERGPSVGDWKPGQMEMAESGKAKFKAGMYYNYYATQVIHQYGGSVWTEWNRVMRDFLIATQSSDGPAKGSWYYDNPDETGLQHGGRLYTTCLAAMTLEVYYRYLPLYDEEKTSEAEFELD